MALDHYEYEVVASGKPTRFLDDGLLSGKQATATFNWVPDQAYWGSDATLKITIVDSAGLRTQTSVLAHVGSDGTVTTDQPIAGPQDEPPPGTINPPAGKTPSTVDCSCRVSGDDAAQRSGWPGALGILGMAGLVVARRRKLAR